MNNLNANLSGLIKHHEKAVELFCLFTNLTFEGDSSESLVRLMTANLRESTEELKFRLTLLLEGEKS
ncbi:hypothetical protein XBP1_750005 [Xenorhabdus bovienii str. puntauvense]|uniref:Uncharacterized protein n=1 Tax=Xenorhabdus bovienii str. puntauvense TaxID=1398201 RepID=A0A077NKX9_XENBV|nr:hypothetical protein [Xenorhabdus bovienii]CDG99188.1 hypothetical protein XBP1_750005 [Xenorhabdus bovienii str. puntauvense]